jgi:hypothetical protein
VLLGDLSRRLNKELVEGFPQNGVRVGLFLDSLAMGVMGKLTSQCTQLFKAVVQCVRSVVSLVDDSTMLKWGKRTVDRTSVDVGVACEIGHRPWGIEVVANTEGGP